MRLVVRRVKDARYPDALFPVWRYHPFMTNSALPTAEADITHRRHAIIETTFADLIDGPLAHIPSGLFAANCAWLACAVIAHNLLRAAGTLAGGHHAVARGATLRRDLVNVPARFAAPARKPMLHLPAHWPWQTGWKTLWDNVIGYSTDRPTTRRLTHRQSLSTPPSQARPEEPPTRKSWYRPADHACATAPHPAAVQNNRVNDHTKSPIHGFRLRRGAVSPTRRRVRSCRYFHAGVIGCPTPPDPIPGDAKAGLGLPGAPVRVAHPSELAPRPAVGSSCRLWVGAGAHAPHNRDSCRSTNLGESLSFWRAPPHNGHCWSATVAACRSGAPRRPLVPASPPCGGACPARAAAGSPLVGVGDQPGRDRGSRTNGGGDAEID